MEYAKRNNVKIIMDIDYRPYTWISDKETSLCYTMACEQCDVIIGTREECDAVEYLWDPDNDNDDVTAKRLTEAGTELVVIKRGVDGSTAYMSSGEVVHSGVVPTKIQKTFGAGDAFAAGFITALMKGKDVKTALIHGSGTASIVISGTDCTDAMPTYEQLIQYLEKHPVEE